MVEGSPSDHQYDKERADEEETAIYRSVFPEFFTGGEVIVQSAEGITGYGGAAADPTGATRKWLDREYARIAEERRQAEEAPPSHYDDGSC